MSAHVSGLFSVPCQHGGLTVFPRASCSALALKYARPDLKDCTPRAPCSNRSADRAACKHAACLTMCCPTALLPLNKPVMLLPLCCSLRQPSTNRWSEPGSLLALILYQRCQGHSVHRSRLSLWHHHIYMPWQRHLRHRHRLLLGRAR
jgi:hypothetical protein